MNRPVEYMLRQPSSEWYWRDDLSEEWVGPFRSFDEAMADYRERLTNQTPKEQP
jgi:hypothetical protein